MKSKKIVKVPKVILDIIPNLLNIQVKIENGELNPSTYNLTFTELIIDFNLGNKS